MREILFRGKNVGNGKWVYGSLIEDCYIVGDVVDWNEEYFNAEWWAMVDPETVGQYTGLKDKNGTKIFEGDITDHTAHETTVKWVWDKHYICFRGEELDGTTRYYFGIDTPNLEVIGNIHDNPELVKEELK